MLYQFLDWRPGRGRKLFLLNAEDTISRVRAASGGTLPMYLDTWEEYTAFAGAASIPLPEMETVARGLVSNHLYPALAWVGEEYTKFLMYIAGTEDGIHAHLLKDPEPVEEIRPLQFNTLMEASVSNVDEGGGDPCSVPDPVTCSPGSTLPGSPNSLSMGTKRFPRLLQPSTRTLVPSHLCEGLKEK